MTKSTSNSPPQGLNWTAVDNQAEADRDDTAESQKQEESNDIKGLFDRNQKTSLTPLPVGENISLPPVPEQDADVKLVMGENDSLSEGESDKPYSPPPVAAFGGKRDAPPDEKAPSEDSTSESARGLFSMDAASDSKEKKVSQADSKAAQPVAAPKRPKAKRTVVGLGPGQPPPPPIPPAAKDADKTKEAKVPRSPTPIKEKPSRAKKPDETKPAAPEALPDTLFSEVSSIPSVPSESAAVPESKGESVKEQPAESPSPEPATQPSVDPASSIRTPPKGNTMRTVALWSGAGLLLVGGLIAAVTVGLNRSKPERTTITVVPERVDPAEEKPRAAQSQQTSAKKVTVKPKTEKPEAERAQTKQTAQPAEPPEQDALLNQKAASIEPPKEARKPENVHSSTEQKPERAGSVRDMLNRGRRQLRGGDLDQAEASFRAILNREPDEHHAMEGLVQILIKRGKAAEALPYCERMVKKRSRRARYRVLYGDALATTGNKKAAKEQYAEALRYSPNDKEAKRRLAQMQ